MGRVKKVFKKRRNVGKPKLVEGESLSRPTTPDNQTTPSCDDPPSSRDISLSKTKLEKYSSEYEVKYSNNETEYDIICVKDFEKQLQIMASYKDQGTPFDEAINLTGFGKYNYYLAFLCGLCASSLLLVGLDLSFTLPSAVCDLELTPSSRAIASSTVFLGSLCGCHMSGLLIDVLGRQYVIARSAFLTTCLYVLTAFAPDFTTFAILKALGGFVACPIGIAIFAYIGESCPSAKISQVIIMTTTIGSIGIVYSTSIAWLILPEQWSLNLGFIVLHPWRLFVLACGLPVLISAILMSIFPESPKFVLACGDKEKALDTLRKIYHTNTGKPKKDFPVECLADTPGEQVALAKNPLDVFKRMWSQTFPLFLPPYLSKVFICSFVYFNIFFCINGLLLWVPEMTNRMAVTKHRSPNETLTLCEMMASVMPDTLEFIEPSTPYSYLLDPDVVLDPNITGTVADYDMMTDDIYDVMVTDPESCVVEIKDEIYMPNLVMALVQPVGMIFISFIIPLFQKKMAIMLFLFIACLLMTSVTIVPNINLIMTIFTLMPLVVSVVYNVITSLTVDFFPTNYRGMAVSLCMMFGRIGSIVGNFAFSYMLDSNCLTMFYFYVGVLFIGIAVTSVIKTPKPAKTSPSDDSGS